MADRHPPYTPTPHNSLRKMHEHVVPKSLSLGVFGNDFNTLELHFGHVCILSSQVGPLWEDLFLVEIIIVVVVAAIFDQQL